MQLLPCWIVSSRRVLVCLLLIFASFQPLLVLSLPGCSFFPPTKKKCWIPLPPPTLDKNYPVAKMSGGLQVLTAQVLERQPGSLTGKWFSLQPWPGGTILMLTLQNHNPDIRGLLSNNWAKKVNSVSFTSLLEKKEVVADCYIVGDCALPGSQLPPIFVLVKSRPQRLWS